MLRLTATELADICQALNYWANFIETGNLVISANDAIRSGRPEEVKLLDDGSKKKVEYLRQLSLKVLTDG